MVPQQSPTEAPTPESRDHRGLKAQGNPAEAEGGLLWVPGLEPYGPAQPNLSTWVSLGEGAKEEARRP